MYSMLLHYIWLDCCCEGTRGIQETETYGMRLKIEYLRREKKPTTKQELLSGTKEFWETVDVMKYRKYIRHLRKVLPRVINSKMQQLDIRTISHDLYLLFC